MCQELIYRIILNWLGYVTTSFSVAAFWQSNMASSNKKSISLLTQVTAAWWWMHTHWYALCQRSRTTIAHSFDPWMQDTDQGCAVLSSQSFNTLYFIRTTLTGKTHRQKQLQPGRGAGEGRCNAADFSWKTNTRADHSLPDWRKQMSGHVGSESARKFLPLQRQFTVTCPV